MHKNTKSIKHFYSKTIKTGRAEEVRKAEAALEKLNTQRKNLTKEIHSAVAEAADIANPCKERETRCGNCNRSIAQVGQSTAVMTYLPNNLKFRFSKNLCVENSNHVYKRRHYF